MLIYELQVLLTDVLDDSQGGDWCFKAHSVALSAASSCHLSKATCLVHGKGQLAHPIDDSVSTSGRKILVQAAT